MISGKVQKELKGDIHFVTDGKGKEYMVKRVGKSYRVYADATGYSQTSGQTLKLGKMQRNLDNLPIKFESVALAEQWLKDGLPLVDKKGNPL